MKFWKALLIASGKSAIEIFNLLIYSIYCLRVLSYYVSCDEVNWGEWCKRIFWGLAREGSANMLSACLGFKVSLYFMSLSEVKTFFKKMSWYHFICFCFLEFTLTGPQICQHSPECRWGYKQINKINIVLLRKSINGCRVCMCLETSDSRWTIFIVLVVTE